MTFEQRIQKLKNGSDTAIWAANEIEQLQERDEALLQQALYALEYHSEQTRPIQQTEAAIGSLRERLTYN